MWRYYMRLKLIKKNINMIEQNQDNEIEQGAVTLPS